MTIMTYKEFVLLTAEVRKLQKEYFKTRDKGVLAESKKKEFTLDMEIRNVLSNPQEFPLPNDIISCPPDCHDTSKTEQQLELPFS